jgi:hypothetical protein
LLQSSGVGCCDRRRGDLSTILDTGAIAIWPRSARDATVPQASATIWQTCSGVTFAGLPERGASTRRRTISLSSAH